MSWISTNSFTGYMDLCYGISSHDQSVFYFPCDPVSAVWFDDWMSLTVILLLCGIPQEQRHEYNHQSTWAFVQDVFLSEVEFYAVHFPSLYRVKSQVTLDAIWNICPFPLISKACNSFDYRHREKEKEKKKTPGWRNFTETWKTNISNSESLSFWNGDFSCELQ